MSASEWTTVDWRAHHRVVDAAGQPIHVVEQGPPGAPAIVFVHGWTGCWQHWVHQFGEFATDHRVIAMDLPGFGGSPMPEAGDISIEAYASTLIDLLDALEIERATLVGSSMGGGVAAQAAIDFPDRVERLVLVSASGLAPRYLGFPSGLITHRLNRPLLDALEIERATLVGSSMGGGVAAQAAIDFPDRVERLVLVSASGLAPRYLGFPSGLITHRLNRPLLEVVMRESPLPKRLAYNLAKRPRLRKAALAWFVADPQSLSGPMCVELISGAGRPAAAAACVALATHRIEGSLGEIACPTLVMWGDRDRVVGYSCAQRFADGIPGARLSVYEDIGHLPFIEAPERFNSELREFLSCETGHSRVTITSPDVTFSDENVGTH